MEVREESKFGDNIVFGQPVSMGHDSRRLIHHLVRTRRWLSSQQCLQDEERNHFSRLEINSATNNITGIPSGNLIFCILSDVFNGSSQIFRVLVENR
jgi:hypothetical protein